MCGRFALQFIPGPLREFLGLPWLSVSPRYNIAPTQYSLAVVSDPESRLPAELTGKTGPAVMAENLYWGLVPFWARDISIGIRSINARCETVAEKPAFKAAIKYRRCLIPATGFYEWKKKGKARIPSLFTNANSDDGLALGGLWEDWSGGNQSLRSFAIITTAANAVVGEVHDRMPVVVKQEDWQRWLDPNVTDPGEVADIMQPIRDEYLRRRQVSDFVNKPGNEGPDCIAAAESGDGLLF